MNKLAPEADLVESKKKHYFINEEVEWKLTKYIWTGCTDVVLRDSIMIHAEELITQLIRKQRLFQIYRGHDPSAFSELVHVAYMQIERTLYKYRSRPHCRSCFQYERPNNSVLYDPSQFEYRIIKPDELVTICPKCPHCGADLSADPTIDPKQGLYGGSWTILYRGMSKVFNMWSQVARTVILAYVKKDTRDMRNGDNYTDYVTRKYNYGNNQQYVIMLQQVKERLWYNPEWIRVCDALVELSSEVDPDKNFKKKISQLAEVDRKTVDNCLSVIRVAMALYAERFNAQTLECCDN